MLNRQYKVLSPCAKYGESQDGVMDIVGFVWSSADDLGMLDVVKKRIRP